MSTKTTFKRVALVAVAALGFGVLSSVAPASATPITPTLVTVGTVPVAQVGVTHTTPVTFTAPFTAQTDTHTITVRVVSAPTGSVYAGTLGTAKITAGTVGTSWINSTSYSGSGGTTVAGNIGIVSTGTAASNGVVSGLATNTTYPAASALMSHSSWVTPDTTSKADVTIMPDVAGSYTVLVSTSSTVVLAGTQAYAAGDASATYTFTTGAAVASISLAAVTGAPIGGSTYGQIYKVTIKDAAGAVTQLASGQAINLTSNVSTTNIGEITAGCTSGCTATYNGAGVTAGLDNTNFSAGVAYIQIKDATAAAADAVITATGSGLLADTLTSTVGFSTLLGTTFASSTIGDAATAVRPGSGKKGIATAGASVSDEVSPSVTSHSYLVTVAAAVTAAKSVAVDWNDVSGQITTLVGARYSTAITAAKTTGEATLSATTAAMLNGYSFSATVGTTTPATVTVTSATATSTASTIAVAPNSVIKAAHGSASALSAVLKDQFGAAKANTVVSVSVTGRNATTTSTTLSTDADGRVAYTLTDAGTAATTNKQSVVTFTPSSGNGTAASVTVNFTDSALGIDLVELATPTTDDTAATGVTYSDINASSTAGAAASTQDITATVTDVNGSLLVGVPVTFSTASAGAAILTTTVTVYTGADGTATASVFGWTAGVKTFTATAGAKSATGTVAFRQGGATGTDSPTEVRNITAVTTGSSIVVTAKDRFGNIVSGVPLFATRTGNGTFGGGSNTNGQTTAADGTAEFLFNAGSAASVVTITAGSATAVSAACYGQTGNLAGKIVCSTAATQTAYTAATVGTTTTAQTGVGDTLSPAGNQTVTVNFAAAAADTTAADNAQAATDAAAEATDAANAATDAANAAAEAADAATAAAQDAADAVAALSAQVAALISGLKAQLTALTNLVIKIQKKVKA